MQRLLFMIFCIYFPSVVFGQVVQVYPSDQKRYNEWFDLVVFDSIASSSDSGSSFSLELAMGQDYFFLDNSKMSDINWYSQGGWKYLKSIGSWHSNYTELITYDYTTPSDTNEVERFYWDKLGRDSAYEVVTEIVPSFFTHEIDYYLYNSAGRLEIKISVDAALQKDTTMVQRYFYGTGGNLDSVVGRKESGERRSKIAFVNASRVEKVFELMYLPSTAGLDTVFTYIPIYNSSGKVDEIREVHHLGTTGPTLRSVHRFYKKTNSSIGLNETELEVVKVFPNPVIDWFQLEIDKQEGEGGNLEVFDVSGRMYKLTMISKEGGLVGLVKAII